MSNITLAQYGRIDSGMAYEDVCQLLGREGQLLAEHTSDVQPGLQIGAMTTGVYEWTNEDGSAMRVMLGDGYVRDKSEHGLI